MTITEEAIIDRILFDFGYIGTETTLRLNNGVFLCDSCRTAFLSGCFLVGGTVTDPNVNYHLEYATNKNRFSSDFSSFLTNLSLEPKTAKRFYYSVVYFKDSSVIEDILVMVGAPNCSMELMNTKIVKGIRNKVNRRINCENANIDKVVQAAGEAVDDIDYLFSSGKQSLLPDKLLETAVYRRDNPELSLSELADIMHISKSGLNHRLTKIREIAATERENNTNDK